MSALETLADFTVAHLPNLDVVTLGALEMLAATDLPEINISAQKPLVVGSGNALSTGQIIFCGSEAIFSDESSVEDYLETFSDIDAVVVVSASGGKHAVGVGDIAKQSGQPAWLITNNLEAPAAEFFDEAKVLVFPRNREPYTYNTSTYLSMILAHTGESAADILDFIENKIEAKLLRNFGDYRAYTIIVPPELALVRDMFRTKFDELFGPHLTGRIFTSEEIKHAKTVVTSGEELFISFGTGNEHFGLPKNRLVLTLPENVNYGAMLAIGYFVIGRIQASHPPYFQNNIVKYTEEVSKIFGQKINPIVE